MSAKRVLSVLLVVSVAGALGAGCSSDGDDTTSSDRGVVEFADPPEGSTDLGLCQAYEIDQIKDIIGGEQSFKRLAPTAIGQEGDPVTGEACAWERVEENGDSVSLRIEARDFGDDLAGLDGQFAELEEGTLEAEPVADLGDDAFSSVSDTTSLLQIRSGGYLLTLSSRSGGELEPVPVRALTLLGASGLEKLP